MSSLRPLDAQIAGGGAGIGGSVWRTYPGSSLNIVSMGDRERERDRASMEWQDHERDRERRKSGTGEYVFIIYLFLVYFSFLLCSVCAKVFVQPKQGLCDASAVAVFI